MNKFALTGLILSLLALVAPFLWLYQMMLGLSNFFSPPPGGWALFGTLYLVHVGVPFVAMLFSVVGIIQIRRGKGRGKEIAAGGLIISLLEMLGIAYVFFVHPAFS